MNVELDILLASYLDNELEPEPRRQVESLLRSDPAAAARFSALGRVRDLVATLSQPDVYPDVSGEVVAIIGANRPTTWRILKFTGSIAAGLAAAALLVFWNFATVPKKHEAGPKFATISGSQLPTVLPLPPTVASALRTIPPSPAILPLRDNLLKSEIQARDNRLELASLLKQGEVRLVNVIVDDLGPASLSLVDDAIVATARVRPKHAKVYLVQGTEIDPTHPGTAVVYVLLMDEFEYGRFRGELKSRLQDRVSEPVAAPALAVASLPAIGRDEILNHARPASTLKPPVLRGSGLIASRPPKLEQSKQRIIDQKEGEGQPIKVSEIPAAKPKLLADQAVLPNQAENPARSVFLVWVSGRDRAMP